MALGDAELDEAELDGVALNARRCICPHMDRFSHATGSCKRDLVLFEMGSQRICHDAGEDQFGAWGYHFHSILWGG